MHWFLILLIASLALSLLQHAIVALAIVLVLAILWGAYYRPAELFGLLAFSLVAHLLGKIPGPALALLAFVGLMALIRTSS